MSSRDIFVATQSFVCIFNGKETVIRAKETYVREGHDLLKQFPLYFRKVEPQYETASVRGNGTRRKPADAPEPETVDQTKTTDE